MTMQRTRVIHLIGSLDAGGAERRMLELLGSLPAGAENHYFLTLSGRRGSLAPEFESLGCVVTPCALSWQFVPQFLRHCRSGPEKVVVHSHVHLASGYLLALAWVGGVERRICHIRSTGDGRRSSLARRLYRAIGRLLLRCFATHVVAVSNSALLSALGNGARSAKSLVVYGQVNGAHFVQNRSDSADTLNIVSIGRVDRDKNCLRALDVVACLVAEERREVVFRIVGRVDEANRRAVERRIHDLGIGSNVILMGESDDVPDILSRAHVLLSTSRREGLPGVVLEAASAGVPSIVSDIAPHLEVGSVLRGVIPVPLAAADRTWVAAIQGAVESRSGVLSPADLVSEFDGSPFSTRYEESRHQMESLWSL